MPAVAATATAAECRHGRLVFRVLLYEQHAKKGSYGKARCG